MSDERRIPRMRTIKETANLLGLPVYFIRCLVSSGEIVAVKSGKKFLINFDRFIDYLNSHTLSAEPQSDVPKAPREGKITPVPRDLG